MKHIIPALVLLCTGYAATAVPLAKKNKAQGAWQEIMQQQLQRRSANKGTALEKRLVGYAYINNGDLQDSAHYYYSKGRGSVHNNPDSYWDNYYPTAIDVQKNILSDSSVTWYTDISNNLIKSTVKAYTYDANNKVLRMDQPVPYLYKHENTYDANGRVIKITSMDTFGTGTLNIRNEQYITYDGQGKRITDSTWNVPLQRSNNKRVYKYDANGNRTVFESYQKDMSNNWILSYRTTNTYDGNNRLVTAMTEFDLGTGTLEPTTKDSFSYSGNKVHPVYHEYNFWDNTSMMWIPNELLTYTLNAQDQPDTMTIYGWIGQWEPSERNVYKYDGGSTRMIRSNAYMHLGSGVFNPSPYDQTNLYYEEYDPNGVDDVEKDIAIALYPNPAHDVLYLNSKNMHHASITIYNMDGRMMMNKQIENSDKEAIDINMLAPGNYILSISANEGKGSKTQFTKL